MIPRSFERNGEVFNRVTIDFLPGPHALQVRAWTHDALIHAHGYPTARLLTGTLARAGGRFRVAIAMRKTKALKRRLLPLVRAGLIALYVAGHRIFGTK
ncbi:hypothetical protein X741_03455 [Mesorhizobium sp. LNHC229A00]|nr:hypothetical protein X741_03455 [Mesorhizobium sp. LNHC229A00]